MATKFVSALTGPEMDSALIDMAYHNSEAYAVGTRNGVPVGSSDVTYHNNSKYWAEQVYGYTDRAEDAANRAEAAVPSGTAGAVFFDRAQTLTSAEQEQARANIMAGGSNRNLLDNPWFTVNQRSFTSTSSGAYFADRWQVSGNTYTLTRRTTGITIKVDNGVAYLFQKMESAIYDFLDGKTVTYSFCFSDGTVVSRTFVWDKTKRNYPLEIPNDPRFQFWYGDAGQPCLRIFTTSTGYDIDAIKLELGPVSTLANDTPPDYGEELRKCMRYFVRFRGEPIGVGYISSNLTNVYLHITTGVQMAKVPTASLNGAIQIRGANGTIGASSISVYNQLPTEGANVVLSLSSQSSTTSVCMAYLNSVTDYIDLSADL